MEELEAPLGTLPLDVAKQLAALILDSKSVGIIQISFIVLDSELSPRLKISYGYAQRLVVSAKKDEAFVDFLVELKAGLRSCYDSKQTMKAGMPLVSLFIGFVGFCQLPLLSSCASF